MRRTFVATLLVFALLAARVPAEARADPPPETVDATYGRIDGDIALGGGLGATFGPTSPRATLDLRFRYLSTAGVFAAYEDGPTFGSASDPRRVLATGFELRPLFLARWLQGYESGRGRLDLLVDSIGIELGAFFAQPIGGALGSRPGLQAGLGIELPVFARAQGPWICVHGGVRWSDAALAGDALRGPSDRALYLSVTVAWQQLFHSRVIDGNDRAPR